MSFRSLFFAGFLVLFSFPIQAQVIPQAPSPSAKKISSVLKKYPKATVHVDTKGELTLLQNSLAPFYPGDARTIARAYLTEIRPFLGPEPLGEPVVREVAGRSLVYFPVEISGIPVFGKGLTIAVAPSGRPTVTLREPLSSLVTTGSLTPTFPLEQAKKIASRTAKQSELAKTLTKLVFFPRLEENRLAYAVVTHERFLTKRVFVDAHTGNVLLSQDLTYDALADVFDVNPGEEADQPLIQVELPPFVEPPSENGLLGEFVLSLNCSSELDIDGSCTLFGNAFLDQEDNLFFTPILDPENPLFREDPFAQVHMFFHVDRIHSFFQALGATDEEEQIFLPDFSGFTTLDSPLPAFSNVRFDEDGNGILDAQDAFNNAFFNGAAIVFGDGAERDFSYDADVIYHEYTHGVISFKLGGVEIDELGLDRTTAGINEGTADIFPILFFDDPELGEFVGGEDGIRNLETERLYPFDLDGESHDDGEIWASAFWEIKERVEVEFSDTLDADAAKDLLARIYIATLFGLPSQTADFGEAALVAVAFAKDIGDEFQIGEPLGTLFFDVFQERGILDAQGNPARRIVPLETPEAQAREGFLQFYFGKDSFGFTEDQFVPGTIQYSVTLEAKTEFQADIAAFGLVAGFPRDSFLVFIREGQPVEFRTEGNSFVALADKTLEDDPEIQGLNLILRNFGDQPKTFFFSLGIDNDRRGIAVVQNVSIEDVTDFAGGGCAVSSTNQSPFALLFLVFVTLFFARRKNR